MNELIFRLLLGCIVVICGAFAGRALAHVDARRADLLAETMDSLQLLRIHMLDSLMPLQVALEKSSGAILTGAALSLGGGSPLDAWNTLKQNQLQRGGFMDCLGQRDIDTLDRFFENLGRSSSEEQHVHFDAAIKELGALENSCRGEGARRSRLYAMLGALAGAALVVAML